MTIVRLLLCALAAAALAARADAQVLYAARAAGSTGELFTLNPATGAVLQDIGPLTDAGGTNYPITGLAFHPTTGVLYGSTGNSVAATAARLVTINPATGRVTVVGSFNAGPVSGTGTPSTMGDLDFDAAGNLFGVGTIGGPQLYSINPATGQATVVGPTGLTSTVGGGLAVSAAGGFFGTPTAARFGTYDPTTGAYTNIANPAKPVGGGYGALDFDASGTLYGLNVGAVVGSIVPTHLVTINPATGAVTDLGASGDFLDAIAFSPVPEPSALALAGLAVAGGAWWRRRR
jgi:hypothetical protein